MALSTGEFFRWEVKGEQYNQAYNFSLDYRFEGANDIPIQEVCEDMKSHTYTWLLAYLVNDLHITDYNLKVYDRLELLAATQTKPERLKVWFGESYSIATADTGRTTASYALPTVVTATGRKVPSGITYRYESALIVDPEGTRDTPARGRIATSGLPETCTYNNQGNELSQTTGSNWYSTWSSVFNAMVNPSFRHGTVGSTYQPRMVIRSDRGKGGVIRKSGNTPYIQFYPVTSIAVSRYLGTQMTRKQRKVFQ